MPAPPSPPWPVRVAGLLTGVQGLAGAVIAVVLTVRAVSGSEALGLALGNAAWFALCAAAVLGVGAGLWRGAQGARSPALVAQVLLLGVSWYAAGPSGQPEYGIPGAAYCGLVLALLLSRPTARWTQQG